MNRKIYLAVLGLIFIVLLFGAPFMKAASDAGVVKVRDLGNMGEEAQLYDGTPFDGALNALVGLKKSLTDLYTDFMPGYYETVFAYGKARDTLNAPTAALYADMRSNAAQKPVESAQASEAPAPTDTLSADGGDTMGTDPSETAAPEPPVDPRDEVVSVSSTLLQTTGTHRYYRIEAAFADGAEITFLDTAVDLSDKGKEARATVQAKKLNKIDANYQIYRFDGIGHEVAASMRRNVPEELRFLEENVIKGLHRTVDALVSDPGLPDYGWSKMTARDLY